jgi:hypothetical protein
MFAYLVIGTEIAILYTVFWYVFLREPKPYKVSGNPWGRYSGKAECGEPPRRVDLPNIRRNPALSYDWSFEDERAAQKSKLPRLLDGFRDTIQYCLRVI